MKPESVWGPIIFWVILVGALVYLFWVDQILETVFVGLLGPVLAVGPPAIYYAHTEWIMTPDVVFEEEQLAHQVAPMYFPSLPLVGGVREDLHLPHIARPAIFTRLTVTNNGRATAKDCMIRVELDDTEFQARWGRTENPERYNLLPGESRTIHLFRTFLTPYYHFLKPSWSEDLRVRMTVLQEIFGNDEEDERSLEEMIAELEHRPLEVRNNIDNEEAEFNRSDLDPATEIPRDQPPEKREESLHGSWLGKELEAGQYSIEVQAIAEDYKSDTKSYGRLSLPDSLVQLLGHQDIEWQQQWEEKGYTDFKDNVIDAIRSLRTAEAE